RRAGVPGNRSQDEPSRHRLPRRSQRHREGAVCPEDGRPPVRRRHEPAEGRPRAASPRRRQRPPAGGPPPARRPSAPRGDGRRRPGWTQIPAGWLVDSSRPLTTAQVADARDAAAKAGLTIEVRRKGNPPTAVMAIATAAGALLALAILALTVGLIRGESA